MRWLAALLCASACWAAETPLPAVSPWSGSVPEGAVVVIPLKGEVSRAQFFFLRRILKMGEAAHARAYVLDMDTPGGELSAGVEILQALMKADAPTFTYVNPNAGSAGALIALGTKQIWMAPVSAIGAAAPVMAGGQEIPETINAKIVSYYSGYFRSAAERNGHNPEIAEAFINKDHGAEMGGKVLCPRGQLLTLSAQEASQKIGGKTVLASGVAASLPALVRDAGLTGPVVEAQPSGFERVALVITTLAPLFLLGGIVGAYLEIKAPGFGVPGIVSAICFLLFFAGHYIAGLTGWEVAVVFALGLAMVLAELVLFPGVVFVAFAGVALMVGALLWAMVDYYPGTSMWPGAEGLSRPMANLAAAVALSGVAIYFLARYLPNIPMLRRLVLTAAQSGGSATAAGLGDDAGSMRAGDRGLALSALRPVGRAEFAGRIVCARAVGEFLDAGAPLIALRVEAGEVVVQEG